jgi:predicted lipid carrier protein YhbT
MVQPTRKLFFHLSLAAVTLSLVLPLTCLAQAPQTSKPDRWLHVRVEGSQPKGETVRVNVPLELAEKILPTINRDRLQNGKVKIDTSQTNGVDLRALFDAIRTSKDGEFVTVQSSEADVRVAKQEGHILVYVREKGGAKKDQVEIRVPMKVVEALLSAGKDELDVLAAIRALSTQGDTELVSVKSSENTVRIWLDSKNISD